ncbi:hypothetical protein [Oceanobacillus sp. CAU 1775]
MNRQIKGLLYFFLTDVRYSFFIFWSILLGILLLSLGIAYFLLDVEGGFFAFGFPFATYFNVLFLGFITVKETISFALRVGAIRRNIFLATGLFFLGYAIFIAVLSSTIQFLVSLFTDAINLHSFRFLHTAEMLGEDTWLTRVLVDTVVLFFILVVTYLFGLLFYRGGVLVSGIVLGVLGVILLLGVTQGWLIDQMVQIARNLDLLFFAQMFVIGMIIYFFTYLLIRRITIVKAR